MKIFKKEHCLFLAGGLNMCELLGLSFNLAVNPSLSFRGFKFRGQENPDGWGIAYYPDEASQLFKEPIKSGESPLYNFINEYPEIRSKLFISHVRKSSRGNNVHKNTHPFRRVLANREYIFAHNGTLSKAAFNIETGKFLPVGDTDSEHAFCYILNNINNNQLNRLNNKDDYDKLHELLRYINQNFGGFNCLFSDGERLFCYHDVDGYNGLNLIKRKAPFDRVKLKYEDFQIDLSEEKSPNQEGYIIASRPLTYETWKKFSPGELIVLENGKIIYSSANRELDEKSNKEIETLILKILRAKPHKVSLKIINQESGLSYEELLKGITNLLDKKYIKQDERDDVAWDHESASYFTRRPKREEIDELLY